MKNTNTFTNIIRDYENEHINNGNGTALQTLATACALSVLKKLHNVSAQKTIAQMRNTIVKDINNMERIVTANNNATENRLNVDGNNENVILDNELNDSVIKLLHETLSDGYDLVNDAVVAILSETQKAVERDGALTVGFMEKPYTIRRLKKKVYIRVNDSVNGWETTETTPIQEVYKAVRRCVQNNRAIQIASNKYVYLDDIATDSETGETATIYQRLPKYSCLACEVIDISELPHGQSVKTTAVTTDRQTVNDMEKLIASLNLTARQALILKYRLCGYGYKAISTSMGVTHNAIINTLHKIQAKAVTIGVTA